MFSEITMPPVLKSDYNVWLIGDCMLDIEDENGNASPFYDQLPTNHEVLKLLFYKKKTKWKGKSLKDVAESVVKSILEVWYLAKIPHCTLNNAVVKLVDLFNHWRWLQTCQNRKLAKDIQNRKEFVEKLSILFDVASPNWEKQITTDRLKSQDEKNEDLKFLIDQRGPRKMCLGKFSTHYAQASTSKMVRSSKSSAQLESEIERQDKIRLNYNKSKEMAKMDDIIDDNGENFECKSKKRHSESVTLNVPRQILKSPGVCEMLDRTKMSTRAAMGNISSFIKASGGDLKDFSLSKSCIWETRNAKRIEEYNNFYKNFQPPKHGVIGWDGKIVNDVLGTHKNVEYLAVVLSGPPHMIEGKMLEVEEVKDGKGKTVCDTSFAFLTACKALECLKQWSLIQLHQILVLFKDLVYCL